jgi:hypothetical protein
MLTTKRNYWIVALALALMLPTFSLADKKNDLPAGKPMLWQEPRNIAALDLYYGPGGKQHAPVGKFKFIKEDLKGSQPKIDLVDEAGTKWKAKLGKEAQPEIVATRLLWAAGYFADENYYLSEARVEGIKQKLKRVKLDDNNILRDARLKRARSDNRYMLWNWFDNPFIGTREFNGLRVMMMLINNWDLKPANNSIIYDAESGQRRYFIYDLGGSFGKTGGDLRRSRNNLEDYRSSKFIKSIGTDTVDFVYGTRPPLLYALDFGYYHLYAKMEKIAKGVPRADARWIGQLLAQLSQKQIEDAFRAAGYNPEETRQYAQAVRDRINELTKL